MVMTDRPWIDVALGGCCLFPLPHFRPNWISREVGPMGISEDYSWKYLFTFSRPLIYSCFTNTYSSVVYLAF